MAKKAERNHRTIDSGRGHSRAISAKVLATIFRHQKNLDLALAQALDQRNLRPEDKGLVRELSFGVMRWYLALDYRLTLLLKKPIKNKDSDVKAVMMIGLYQLYFTRIPAYASIDESVNACRTLRKSWASHLVNGVLRQAQRRWPDKSAFLHGNTQAHSHPDWLLQKLQSHWPDHWPAIVQANNRQARLFLRVNFRKNNLLDYCHILDKAGIGWSSTESVCGLILESGLPARKIPGFNDGLISIQDVGAQLVFDVLTANPGDRILDACAAPGGKIAHQLERIDGLDVVAIERHPGRGELLRQNLNRLDLAASVHINDAAKPNDWWDGVPFDLILLDAPCSGSGVISRHPDIKYLKTPRHIEQLIQQQRRLLKALWPLLKIGGHLVYSTCSILPEENELQLQKACSDITNCHPRPIPSFTAIRRIIGCQRLPGVHTGDGFYYGILEKSV